MWIMREFPEQQLARYEGAEYHGNQLGPYSLRVNQTLARAINTVWVARAYYHTISNCSVCSNSPSIPSNFWPEWLLPTYVVLEHTSDYADLVVTPKWKILSTPQCLHVHHYTSNIWMHRPRVYVRARSPFRFRWRL